jgi:N-acetylneuraminic acid mutarotase
MIYQRWGHALGCVNETIFAFGGYQHNDSPGADAKSIKTGEKFDLQTGLWTEIAPMTTPRAFFGFAVIHDQFIYALGGMDGNLMLDTIERYDEILDSWLDIKMILPQPLAKMGCVSLGDVGLKTSILIVGGIDKEYIRQNLCTTFQCEYNSFEPMVKMQLCRIFNPGSGVQLIHG